MRLVIEIDEADYAETMYRKQHSPREMDWADGVIAKGIPLENVIDDIKAEIQNMPKTYPYTDHIDDYVKTNDVLRIIDRHIGKEKEK